LTQTKTEIWDNSWEHNVEAARLAEDAGLEFLLPLGRWRGMRGYPAETDDEGGSFETLTWASGILALTERITVFGTLHVAYVNPLFAAKQIVTAHHIGRGRFGLNVVSGTTHLDFQMFGVPFGDHDARYDYTEEWVGLVKRMWTEAEPFDHTGKHFTLKSVLNKPKPYGGVTPMLISAGASHRGRAFAVRHADALFTAISNVETLEEELRVARALRPGERVPVYASGHLIARPTTKEADEYYHHLVYELGFWEGVEEAAAQRMQNRTVEYNSLQRLREQIISGNGTYAVRGSYDDVARQFAQLHAMGLDGMAIALVDYIADFPWLRDEVLPRMERLGLRRPAA
jgi:alkanesulfonate monooxygenase SsuD/methylene tetrahydromethanopterin reductase-like flavin-dependent oxidoreductase (luciferase family)